MHLFVTVITKHIKDTQLASHPQLKPSETRLPFTKWSPYLPSHQSKNKFVHL